MIKMVTLNNCQLIRLLIRPKFSILKLTNFVLNFKKYIKLREQAQNYQEYLKVTDNGKRAFDDFKNQNISMTHTLYDEEKFAQHPINADAFICGSDQIWNLSKTHDAPAANPIFFLNLCMLEVIILI